MTAVAAGGSRRRIDAAALSPKPPNEQPQARTVFEGLAATYDQVVSFKMRCSCDTSHEVLQGYGTLTVSEIAFPPYALRAERVLFEDAAH